MATTREKFSSQASPELLSKMREIARSDGPPLPGSAGRGHAGLHRGQDTRARSALR